MKIQFSEMTADGIALPDRIELIKLVECILPGLGIPGDRKDPEKRYDQKVFQEMGLKLCGYQNL
jgi:hypothetical protein